MTSPTMSSERVKAARELLGLSQEELAEAAGLSQGLISQLERGNKPVTADALQAITRGTRLPASFFDRGASEAPSISLRFRKYRTASARDTTRTSRTFTELFDVVNSLLEAASIGPPTLVRATGSSGENDIEHLANVTRAALGVAVDQPIRHLTRALERLGIPVAPIVFSDLAGDEVEEVAALGHFGISAQDRASSRCLIAYFPSSGDRQRFTLAHELAHIVLHDPSSPQDQAREAEADRFAGALLLPEASARELFRSDTNLRDFAHLKAQWGISIQALVMRSHHLGVIDSDRRTSLFKQISARGWRKNEPVLVPHENPALLGELVGRRFGAAPGCYTRAAHDLGLPAVQLKGMMPQPVPVQAVSSRGSNVRQLQSR